MNAVFETLLSVADGETQQVQQLAHYRGLTDGRNIARDIIVHVAYLHGAQAAFVVGKKRSTVIDVLANSLIAERGTHMYLPLSFLFDPVILAGL